MRGQKNILILGGTTEASSLAKRLAEPGGRFAVTTSLAGRTTAPAPLPGSVRVGGFGGAGGFARYLRETGTDAVVDATHPFAARMPWNASEACARTGTPLVRLERPAWTPGPGDRWTVVPDLAAASAALDGSSRIFLTTGRQELAPFAVHADKWFLIRSIEPPGDLPLRFAEVVLAKGPFTVPEEEALMATHAVDTLVTKNSGAQATAAKLEAARRLDLRVVMVERPPKPDGARAATVSEALAWLDALFPLTTPAALQ
jgi:precorrin-6A/cobalt-precorrin-6A reductase